MSTTNPQSIRSALEATLAGLTPPGSVDFGRASYSKASGSWEWEERPAEDRDREFTVEDIPPGRCMWIGSYAEAPHETTFTVAVGHRVGADFAVGRGRRDRDLQQIASRLSWPANYPTSVLSIQFVGLESSEFFAADEGALDGSWISVLRFRLVYLASVQGE